MQANLPGLQAKLSYEKAYRLPTIEEMFGNEDLEMGDIGILASTDPVALDKACVDLVYASDDPGKVHLIERIESRHGTHTLDHAAAIGLGDPDYELIDIDN